MKKNTWIYIAIAAAAYWYWMKRKKDGKPLLPSPVSDTANTARTLVADAIDQTTFTPDTTTFKDLYKQDINACK